jgi:hypothetical protein
MSHCIYSPPNELVKKCLTVKNKKPFEPPMNTDEHRLKADKKKYMIKNKLGNRQCLALIVSIVSQARAAVRTNPYLLTRKTWGEAMNLPFVFVKAGLIFIRTQGDKLFIFIMSLSVFIGVHRWLKILYFNFKPGSIGVCFRGSL